MKKLQGLLDICLPHLRCGMQFHWKLTNTNMERFNSAATCSTIKQHDLCSALLSICVTSKRVGFLEYGSGNRQLQKIMTNPMIPHEEASRTTTYLPRTSGDV